MLQFSYINKKGEQMKKWLLKYGTNRNTWRCIAVLISAVGVKMNPELTESIIAAGVAFCGLIGVLIRGQ